MKLFHEHHLTFLLSVIEGLAGNRDRVNIPEVRGSLRLANPLWPELEQIITLTNKRHLSASPAYSAPLTK